MAVLAEPIREIWSRVQICDIYKMADCSRPEVDSDIISGRIEDGVETNLCANFGEPASSGTFLFPPAHPPTRPPVPCAMTIPALEATLRRAVIIRIVGWEMTTRNTPIGVVVREPSAVNHYFRGGLTPKLGFGGT